MSYRIRPPPFLGLPSHGQREIQSIGARGPERPVRSIMICVGLLVLFVCLYEYAYAYAYAYAYEQAINKNIEYYDTFYYYY
jgi:hypothetical protein